MTSMHTAYVLTWWSTSNGSRCLWNCSGIMPKSEDKYFRLSRNMRKVHEKATRSRYAQTRSPLEISGKTGIFVKSWVSLDLEDVCIGPKLWPRFCLKRRRNNISPLRFGIMHDGNTWGLFHKTYIVTGRNMIFTITIYSTTHADRRFIKLSRKLDRVSKMRESPTRCFFHAGTALIWITDSGDQLYTGSIIFGTLDGSL